MHKYKWDISLEKTGDISEPLAGLTSEILYLHKTNCEDGRGGAFYEMPKQKSQGKEMKKWPNSKEHNNSPETDPKEQ